MAQQVKPEQVIRVKLDLINGWENKRSLQLKQADNKTRYLFVRLTNLLPMNITGYQPTIIIKRADGKAIAVLGNVIDYTRGEFAIPLIASYLKVVGTLTFEVVLVKDGDKILSFPQFQMQVVESFHDDVVFEPEEDDLQILWDAISKVGSITGKLELEFKEFKGQKEVEFQSFITEKDNEFQIKEVERQNNEIVRQENESSRQNSEFTREENEKQRQSNELLRQQKESTRDTSEKSREENETLRQASELERQDNESIRELNETSRLSEESNRQANETLRENTETERQVAELDRQQAEEERRKGYLTMEERLNEIHDLAISLSYVIVE